MIACILSIVMALQAVVPAPSFSSFSEKVFCPEKLENVKYVVDKSIPSEGYELHVLKRKIVVRSSDDAGRFYALQTLSQLSSARVMHCGVVKDAPRYSWRGFMLDEARHFHGKEKVKELLDLMARYKLNRFHWHLADDQGWRVEIKAYPSLCTVGAVGCYSDASAPARFYSQEDIREIVAYAAERHIVIIPEIDMPGHASAFTRAFPELAFGPRTVDPSKEKLYEVLRTIVGELASVFPGPYMHIGGDEVSGEGWKERQKGFEQRYAALVREAGKTPVMWDEALESGVSGVIHWWRAEHPEALGSGLPTIVSPWDTFYLDYIQDARCKEGHLASQGYVNDLEGIYNYPLTDSVLGVQANLWTERVITGDRLDYMVFPRLIALAEKAWSSTLDYSDFLRRLEGEYRYLDSIGVYYYDFRDFERHPEPRR